MEIAVLNIEGKETGRKITLDDAIFGLEPNEHAIYLDVKQHMGNRRQGTHKSKERWENAHSTRKIKRQKGTGGARAGSIKSPVFVGGGTIFGPQPRDYSTKLNKKIKQLARWSALSYKAKNEGIVVVEDFNFDVPKTKEFLQVQKNLQVNAKKSLFVLADNNDNVYKSARNLPKTKVITLSGLNTYSIVDAGVLVFSESSINVLQQKA